MTFYRILPTPVDVSIDVLWRCEDTRVWAPAGDEPLWADDGLELFSLWPSLAFASVSGATRSHALTSGNIRALS